MQWLAAISVKRPVFASVLILTLTVIGAFSFSRLGLDRFPKVDFPTVVVQTRLPGAAPEEVETEISDKIEEAVNTISGIDELRSTSSEGVSMVIVAFQLEKDGDIAAQEVRDRVNRVLPLLPRNIDQPVVEKFDPDAAPVMTLAVSADKPIRDITEYADKVLRRQLESVNGVGQVVVMGGRQRQINITLDPARLQAYNLTVTDVSRALQAQNAEVPGGRVEAGSTQMTLRTRGRVQSVAEFGDVVLKQRQGHPILLRDVAIVEDGMADATTRANVSGKPTVLLTIRRQSGVNTVAMVDAVNERLEEVKAIMPPGYKVWVVRDLSEFIRASIKTVEEHLVLGSILAAAVVLVFLWNWRSTIIAAIAIPTSIIATFGLIWYEDFTLNSMTMLALTLAVGIVIDDAIVVLENIYRFVEEKGMSPAQAAVEATKEIGLAVMATTLSLIAIFVPVGFMGGIVGRFMKSFGLTMSFAIMVSLLVSFTLTPMLSARWIKAKKDGHEKASKDNRFFKPIDDGYKRLLSWSLAHRGLVAIGAVLILLSSGPLFMFANKNFLPNDDQSEFEVSVRAPEGASIDATELIANRIATGIRRLPEVDYTLVTIADDPSQTQNAGTIYVRLKPLEQRKRDQFAVMSDVRANVMPQFAADNLRTGVQPVATIGGGGRQNAEIQFTINGPDLGKLEQFANAVAEAARKERGAVDVDTSLNVGKPELSVQLDRLKAADLGVQVADAAEALRLLVGGDQVSTYNEGGEQYEVHVRAVAGGRADATGIGQLTVPSSTVGSVPLENIADLRPGSAPSNVDRLNRQRQVTVYAGLLPGVSQTPIMDAMTKAADSLNMGPGYSTRFAGRSRELGRAAQNFLIAFVLSLVFMYLILAAQFESWLHPVTILLSLPLTLPFALLSIIITQQSLNIFSALGLLVLFGVVKKNSILQIDHANQLRETGMQRDAAILQASHDRLRPILMTTAAFVAGMIPLVMSSGIGAGTNRAIGFVIIGGQSLVLVLSLLVTPVAYSLLDDLSNVRILPRLWALARRAAPATAALLAMAAVLYPATARAQSLAPASSAQQPTTPQAPVVGEVIRLTAEDASKMAIANNPDLLAGGYDPRISAERVAQATAAFLPTLTSGIQRNVQETPASNVLLGSNGVRTDLWSGDIGLGQLLPVGGGSYAVGWSSVRTNASSSLSTFNPAVSAQLQAAYSQPLLRDFKIDQARGQVALARQAERIADIGLQELGTQVSSSAERAYWNLVLARASVGVQQQAVDLSMELERNNRARVDVGQSPPLDLVSARAEVAARREQLIVAQTLVRQAEDQLRILILDPKRPDYWYVRLETADLIPPVGPSPDVDAGVRNALAQRTDLERTRRQIDISDTNVALAKNATLPDVRVQAGYLTNALGGTELTRDGFLGPITGQSFVAFGDVLGQLFRASYPTWQVGVTLSYPLGRSADQANYARTTLAREQTVAQLRSAELKVVREVRQAAMQLDQNRQRIETTRLARELSEQRLDAEQKRFEVGMSTNFNVIQAQRDLAVARNSELQAQLDYQQAYINYQTVQKVGGSSATTVTTGTGTATVGTTTTPSGATVTTVTGTGSGPGGGL